MTGLGVAVPWVTGFTTFIIPASVSTRAVPGQCPIMGFWPSKDGEKVWPKDLAYVVVASK